jgi:hypothetical protein
MILTATSLSRLLSRALTTFPKVPCPRSESISSVLLSVCSGENTGFLKLTSVSQVFPLLHFVVTILIVH